MKRYRYREAGVRVLGLMGLVCFVLITSSQSSDEADSAKGTSNQTTDLVKRGKYLVHDVAMCVVCHTPKDAKGNLIETRLLEGAPIPVSDPYPDHQEWAFRAPRLAGLPGGWTEETLVKFLQTGKSPTRFAIRPPMPPFRMTEQDAKAVVAYLQSLDPKK